MSSRACRALWSWAAPITSPLWTCSLTSWPNQLNHSHPPPSSPPQNTPGSSPTELHCHFHTQDSLLQWERGEEEGRGTGEGKAWGPAFPAPNSQPSSFPKSDPSIPGHNPRRVASLKCPRCQECLGSRVSGVTVESGVPWPSLAILC